MTDYKIEMYTRKFNVFDDLADFNPSFNENKKIITVKNLNKEDIKKVKKYCKKNNIRYNLINTNFERGSSYRRAFFDANKGINNHYFCAYCGRYIPKNDITVDHIISIHSVKYSPIKQKIIGLFGIKNINDEKNLTPACFGCNRRKGTTGGLWSVKGFTGKCQWLWFVRHTIIFILLCVFFYYFYAEILLFPEKLVFMY